MRNRIHRSLAIALFTGIGLLLPFSAWGIPAHTPNPAETALRQQIQVLSNQYKSAQTRLDVLRGQQLTLMAQAEKLLKDYSAIINGTALVTVTDFHNLTPAEKSEIEGKLGSGLPFTAIGPELRTRLNTQFQTEMNNDPTKAPPLGDPLKPPGAQTKLAELQRTIEREQRDLEAKGKDLDSARQLARLNEQITGQRRGMQDQVQQLNKQVKALEQQIASLQQINGGGQQGQGQGQGSGAPGSGAGSGSNASAKAGANSGGAASNTSVANGITPPAVTSMGVVAAALLATSTRASSGIGTIAGRQLLFKSLLTGGNSTVSATPANGMPNNPLGLGLDHF